MKACPQCKRTYADETLAFCLADGALLSAPYDPNATLVLTSPTNQSDVASAKASSPVEALAAPETLRMPAPVDPHTPPKTTEVLRTPTVSESAKPRSNPLWLYLAIAFAGLFVGALVIVWMMSGKTGTESEANPNTLSEPAQTVSSSQGAPAPTVPPIDISGSWRDQFGFVSYITQQDNSFKMTTAGIGCRGNFNTSAAGLITGNTFEMTYTSTYSTGDCSGTISEDGRTITSICNDTACKRFLVSSRKQ